jgi:hypothetical protein
LNLEGKKSGPAGGLGRAFNFFGQFRAHRIRRLGRRGGRSRGKIGHDSRLKTGEWACCKPAFREYLIVLEWLSDC